MHMTTPPLTCDICGEETPYDFAEQPPHPKCEGCAEFHQRAIEKHTP